jgi:hypothetical protein
VIAILRLRESSSDLEALYLAPVDEEEAQLWGMVHAQMTAGAFICRIRAEFVRRLVSLVPLAKTHLTSFHGVYAPHAALHRSIRLAGLASTDHAAPVDEAFHQQLCGGAHPALWGPACRRRKGQVEQS